MQLCDKDRNVCLKNNIKQVLFIHILNNINKKRKN